MHTPSVLVGIDPGWKNCGWAVLFLDAERSFHLVKSQVDNPSLLGDDYPCDSYLSITSAIKESDICKDVDLHSVTLERYVPYNNTFTAEAENITMLIGGVRQVFKQSCTKEAGDSISTPEISLYRAIDWKIPLVKLLVRYFGFDNPSQSLDKGFSMAAANFILKGNYEIKTDHEADAICLAAFPALQRMR